MHSYKLTLLITIQLELLQVYGQRDKQVVKESFYASVSGLRITRTVNQLQQQCPQI